MIISCSFEVELYCFTLQLLVVYLNCNLEHSSFRLQPSTVEQYHDFISLYFIFLKFNLQFFLGRIPSCNTKISKHREGKYMLYTLETLCLFHYIYILSYISYNYRFGAILSTLIQGLLNLLSSMLLGYPSFHQVW